MKLKRFNKLNIKSNRLNFLKLAFFASVITSVILVGGCKKKNRLTSSTYNFGITPPAATVVQSGSLTLNAHGTSPEGNIEVNPTWELSSSVGTLNPTIGPTVIFTPQSLGEVTVRATYDGLVAASQLVVVTHQSGSTIYDVYDDDLPVGMNIQSDIFTSSGLDISTASAGYNPQGFFYQKTVGAVTGNFWGVTLDANNMDLSESLQTYAGNLIFAIRLSNRVLNGSETIRIEIRDLSLTAFVSLVEGQNGFSGQDTDWQEITIPIGSFTGVNTAQIKVPFAVVAFSLSSALDFDVDAVRWVQ